MSKHTQGRWLTSNNGELIKTLDDSQGEVIVAMVFRQNQKANAYLISSAPDMLEALKKFSDYVNQEQSSTDGPVKYSNSTIQLLAFMARDAIAKAEGKA
jgi:hypothetical protein